MPVAGARITSGLKTRAAATPELCSDRSLLHAALLTPAPAVAASPSEGATVRGAHFFTTRGVRSRCVRDDSTRAALCIMS